jgi:hypothetical protein
MNRKGECVRKEFYRVDGRVGKRRVKGVMVIKRRYRKGWILSILFCISIHPLDKWGGVGKRCIGDKRKVQ